MTASAASPGVRFTLMQPFIQHALIAGTAIAPAAGLVGYFLVLRAQVFTGDALSHVAFTGAMAALAGGYDLRLGLFAAPAGAALRLTDRPYRGLGLAAGLAVAEMWTGLLLSAAAPKLPPTSRS